MLGDWSSFSLNPAFWPSAVVGLLVLVAIRKLMRTEFYSKLFLSFKRTVKQLPVQNMGISKSRDSQAGTGKEECNAANCCQAPSSAAEAAGPGRRVTVLYATTTGKSQHFSRQLADKLSTIGLAAEIINAADIGSNIEERMKQLCSGYRPLLVVIISSYTGGSPPPSAAWWADWLRDTAGDFRVSHNLLAGLQYTVFGLGDSLYTEHYNTAARETDRWLHQLQASRIHPLGLGDDNVAASKAGSVEGDFESWSDLLLARLRKDEQGEVGEQEKEEEQEEEQEDESGSEAEDEIVDLEDIGKMMKAGRARAEVSAEPKEMVTPLLRKSLTKQGYKIIGTHSGVKLCRWTKAMLRGRGGCYKHTFYGIESHRCMETTPSLACANKCVFCWRHHSNPVGTEWRWKMESAEFILAGALANHYKMINEFKGVPGVLADKLEEGMHAKHCALSLVGEPIMYPEINKFVRLLHKEGISSFLVTNAQFPAAIRAMEPCTQLYVSIDASTKESLKKIDRPLFKDFWERFLASLAELREKGQRTVYRLTLVKGWNAEEMDNYARLVELGQPDFIEIKGVTFCGSSKASSLTMENVPWHSEVVRFVADLVDRLPGYSIASEHEHSNCVLVASERFRVAGQWRTWIDYDRFHSLVAEHHNTGRLFTGLDYCAATPAWAVYGSPEQGFDPQETRWHRKGRPEANVEGGCG